MKDKIEYLYESESDDYLLTEEEEKIMRAMRRVDSLWKKYKNKPGGNRLILFCGGTGCEMRIDKPFAKYSIADFPGITCDGGDGADKF